MLTAVKLALRITHTYLDADISLKIEIARAELIRSGISTTKANSDTDPLIKGAIISYVQSEFASEQKMKEGYLESFRYQMENLRKSSGYMEE